MRQRLKERPPASAHEPSFRKWAPLAVALFLGVILLSSAWLIRSTVTRASDAVARGQAEALLSLAKVSWRAEQRPPDDEMLQRFLDGQRDQGLRYVAVLHGDGSIMAEAGDALGSSIQRDRVLKVGDRLRFVGRIAGPPHPPPPHHRPPATARPSHAGPLQPPSPPHDRRGPPLVIFEFESQLVDQFHTQATQLLLVAMVATVALILLALAFSWQLRQRESLIVELERDRRLAALGEMAAVLAHELRNPLASLKGNAQLLEESTDGKDREKATRVVREAVRLEHLVTELLDFVRTGDLHLRAVNPSELLRTAALTLAPATVEVESAPDVGACMLDPDRMKEALVNVMENAVQASAHGGSPQATVSTLGDRLLFVVTDSGSGIPPGEEEKMFEPFHTRRVQGTGLGLAITRRIVEQHGGTIRARNMPAGGAELTIDLPCITAGVA